MSFSTLPSNVSTSQISMTASFVADIHGPVEYYLDYTGSPSFDSGGMDSGWQTSRAWLNDSLETNGEYCYRAWARDNSQSPNLTMPSGNVCTYTSQAVPGGISAGTVTTTSISVSSVSLPDNLTLDASGLKITNQTNAMDSGWKQNNNAWVSAGLTPANAYTFVATARNGDGDITADSSPSTVHTLAKFPAVNSLAAVSRSVIHVELNANGNSGQATNLGGMTSITNGAEFSVQTGTGGLSCTP